METNQEAKLEKLIGVMAVAIAEAIAAIRDKESISDPEGILTSALNMYKFHGFVYMTVNERE